MSLEGSIKKNIGELIYEAIETIRGKKYKIPNEFSICNYLNVNTDKIRISLNTVSTDSAILNDSDFSNKSNDNIESDLNGTQ